MDAAVGEASELDIQRIMAMIPHRYPMLLIDRMTEVVADRSAVGIKNVSINEAFFQGHFPRRPVMPGVMIIESMAQTAAVLVVFTLGETAQSKLVYFMSVENARFRRPVVPGDTMRIHVRKLHARRAVWKFEGQCLVDGKLCAEAVFTAMIMDD